jgi:glutamate formiminotransferase/formiminotetrahydrofolate cyclodeaminase
MNLSNLTVKAFLDELASGSPAPGGGSTAALAGALASGLCAMAARLTLGREKLRDSWPAMEEAVGEADRLRARFVGLVDEDADAYLAVAAARKLPKATEAEQEVRRRALACAVLRSARVPLETLLLAGQTLGLAARVLERGTPSCLTDTGSAVQAVRLAAEAAAWNVKVNLPGIADEAERSRLARETDGALAAARSESDRLAGIVEARLGESWTG